MTLYRVTSFETDNGIIQWQHLHNGITHFAVQYADISTKAKLNIIQLPNGALFDPNYANDAPAVPQPFVSHHVIRMATKAAANLELKAIKALVGRRGELTAVPYDGSQAETCMARLERVDATQKLQEPNNTLQLKLHFVPLEKLS